MKKVNIIKTKGVNRMSLSDRERMFIERATETHNGCYDYTKVKYVKASLKVTITCLKHGDFVQRPNDHLRGNGCPSCKFETIASMKRKSASEFACDAIDIHGNQYDYSKVKYVNAITKVEIICYKHGSFWQTRDKHVVYGTGCPKCSDGVSRGERRIQNILDTCGITYEREKRFADLYGSTRNSRLRYDFWIPSFNLLIEYDGEHHFSAVRTKGRLTKEQAIDRHDATVINDAKKTEYAQANGYNLERIRYDQNVEEVLSKILDRHRRDNALN